MQTEAKLLQAEKKARTRIRAAATLLLLAPRRYAESDFAESVLLARLNSARAGVAAADAALAKLKLEPMTLSVVKAGAEDYGRANVVARNYSTWLKTSPLGDLSADEARALVLRRADRIAATESATAFNDGLRAEAQKVARDRDVTLYRTWSALGDACPLCWDNHGDRVRINESYRSGEEPGHVHVSCRCSEEYST